MSALLEESNRSSAFWDYTRGIERDPSKRCATPIESRKRAIRACAERVIAYCDVYGLDQAVRNSRRILDTLYLLGKDEWVIEKITNEAMSIYEWASGYGLSDPQEAAEQIVRLVEECQTE